MPQIPGWRGSCTASVAQELSDAWVAYQVPPLAVREGVHPAIWGSFVVQDRAAEVDYSGLKHGCATHSPASLVPIRGEGDGIPVLTSTREVEATSRGLFAGQPEPFH
jgi:hypothetical protein